MKLCNYTILLIVASLFATAIASSSCKDEKDCDWILEHDGCDFLTTDGQTVGESRCRVSCNECTRIIEESNISTDQLCYEQGATLNDILVSFENKDPLADDWLGIYKVTADSTDLGNPLDWSWLCGPHHDKCKVQYATIRPQTLHQECTRQYWLAEIMVGPILLSRRVQCSKSLPLVTSVQV